MTPQTLTKVEDLINKKLHLKLSASGLGACRRIVNDALEDLKKRYSHPSQLKAYLLEEGRLKKLLSQLGD